MKNQTELTPTEKELAEYCLKSPGCYKCPNDEMKKRCVSDKCWKEPNVKDRKPPCVYYGLLAK